MIFRDEFTESGFGISNVTEKAELFINEKRNQYSANGIDTTHRIPRLTAPESHLAG